MSRTRLSLVAVTVALCATAACASPNVPVSSASGGSSTPTAPVAAVVTLAHVSFGPSVVTINAGQAVEWVWADNGIPHNVTFASVHSATQTTGKWYRTFNSPGVYPYRCTIHASMTGAVIVR
jgi:plastocyanin